MIRDYAEKALKLDPTNRSARRTMILERFYVDRDYQGAINELHQQIVSNPGDSRPLGSYATILETVGKLNVAVDLRRYALELNPLSAIAHRTFGDSLQATGKYAEAEDSYRQAERLGLKSPQQLVFNAMLRRSNAGVIAQLDRDWPDKKLQKLYTAFYAYSQDDSTSFEALRTEIDASPGRDTPFIRGGVMLLEGNIDGTLDLFEQQMNVSDYSTMLIARNFPPFRLLFPELYEHPRYHEMLKQFCY